MKTLKNKLWNLFSSKKWKNKCKHDDFWSLYKIINFNRRSMTWVCWKCWEEITLKYLWYDALSRNLWVAAFSCILWLSPAILIILISSMLAEIYGPWIYFLAIIDVVIFHFWAMYYIIRGGLVEVTTKK